MCISDTVINIFLRDIGLIFNKCCKSCCDFLPAPSHRGFFAVIELEIEFNAFAIVPRHINSALAGVTAYSVLFGEEFGKLLCIVGVFTVELLYTEFSVLKARAVVNKLIFQGFFNIHTADNSFFGLFFFHRLAKEIKLNRLIVIIVKFSFGDFLKIFVLGGSFGNNLIGNGGRSVVCFLNLRLLCLAFNLRNKSLCLFGNGDIACISKRYIVHNRRESAVFCAKHRTVVVFVIPNMESNRNGINSH